MQKELTRLRDLHDRGVLTSEEFERAVSTLEEGGGQRAVDGPPSEQSESTVVASSSGPNFVGATTSKPRWGRRVALGLAAVALVAVGSVGTVVLLDGSGEPVETQAVSDGQDAKAQEPAVKPSVEADGEEVPAEQAEPPIENEQEPAEPAADAIDADDPASYYRLDGTKPALSPDCHGVMGFCLGSPVEAVTDALGREAERYGGSEDGSIVRRWDLGGSSWLTVEADGIGSITQIGPSFYPEPDDVRVALPESDLSLGKATFADVITSYGEPLSPSASFEEGSLFFVFEYVTGPEGTVVMKFAAVLDDWDAEEESAAYGDNAGNRDAIIAAISDRLVTSFSVGY